MEEKILIKSEQYNVKKFLISMLIIGAILSAIGFIGVVSDEAEYYDMYYETYEYHQYRGYCFRTLPRNELCNDCEIIKANPTKIGYALDQTFEDLHWNWYYFAPPFVAFALIGSLVYLWLRSYELTITDKRVFGKVAWGARVDLPVDSVSATATISLWKGVSVSTSSGRISFLMIKNANEIYKVMSDLLIERQQTKANAATTASAPQISSADQLKEYKELLDSGVITQEEFDAKKKQLLGL